ncbi:MAG: LytR C-terminal domain-containing protein [Acidimicrobiia bacterium]
MPEIGPGLADRLRALVADEEAPVSLRSGIQQQLRRPHPRSGVGPRVLVLATAAAMLVAVVAVAGGQGPFSSDRGLSVVTPAAQGHAPAAPDLPHGRSGTRVLASDATRTPGIASATLQRLQAAGYVTAGSLDAPERATTTRIYFVPGYEAEARDVARVLGLGESAVNRTPPAVPDPNGAEILVVIGSDLVAPR